MNIEQNFRKQIFTKIKEIYKLRKKKEAFVPGKTKINYAGRVYDEKELMALVDASLNFWLTAGKYAQQFETELSRFLKVKYCLLTNSGSSANLLAVSALTSPLLGKRRLQPGDEIITTACGFPTTVNPVVQNNLMPVFVDIEIGTYNIDVNKIEKAITPKTKAIIVAHNLGNPAEINKILAIIKKYKLWLIEDNCDALGSRYKNHYTGTFGDISTLSFYPAHHITMGEGGAVITSNPLLKKIITSLRDWGRDCWCETGHDNTCRKRFSQKHGQLPWGYDHKYVYSHLGYNLKITDLQAAIGCAQLKKLNSFILARRKNFNFLYRLFKKYDQYFILPASLTNSSPSWFGFPLLIKESAPFKRKQIVEYLEKNKIATRMLFAGNLTKQPAYQKIKYRISGGLKNSDLVMNNLFWLGVYPGITKNMLFYIKRVLNNFCTSHNFQ